MREEEERVPGEQVLHASNSHATARQCRPARRKTRDFDSREAASPTSIRTICVVKLSIFRLSVRGRSSGPPSCRRQRKKYRGRNTAFSTLRACTGTAGYAADFGGYWFQKV